MIFRTFISFVLITGLLLSISCKKSEESHSNTVKDYEGNIYKTVMIGGQVWMAENLKATKYNDGIAIPLVTDNTAWSSLTTPAYCWNNNDATTTKNTYGALYNWYAVNSSKICPTGWHVPSDDDWKVLEVFLGMTLDQSKVEGWRGTDQLGKLKETGTSHWTSPNTGATNSSGFTALPGGERDRMGAFGGIGGLCHFWTSSESSTTYAYSRQGFYYLSTVYRGSYVKNFGFSVRCVRN
jgi:uncharacterized protein (TIGR02145 family)